MSLYKNQKIKIVLGATCIASMTMLCMLSNREIKGDYISQSNVSYSKSESIKSDLEELDYNLLADRTLARIIKGEYENKNISDAALHKAVNATKKLPTKLINKFVSMGYKIYFAKDLENVEGVTHLKRHIVLLAEDTENLEFVTLHEYGHIFYEIQTVEYMQKANKAYSEECLKYMGYSPDYAKKDLAEYHASSFAQYILEPERLKQERPLTFELIREGMKSYELK
ncbi:hypothetical protein UT300012_21370 [Paraclostridium bifermentans]